MNKIEFTAGYYEWNIYIDDNHFYTFGDGICEDIQQDTTYEDLEFLVEEYIDAMNVDLQENNKKMLEDEEIKAELKRQMIDKWSYHFGIKKIESEE